VTKSFHYLLCSQAKKLESSGTIREERYKEVCRLVVEAFTKDEGSMQYEAFAALNAIIQEFKSHSLHLFESMLQTDKKTRFVLLNFLRDLYYKNTLYSLISYVYILNFLD